ncbi:hypothetical protein Taro_031817, partial [Colocasia esculenta]|nr:hypothetical protein [Colocasia esculenta]
MERVAWGGYNCGVSPRTYSAPSGHTFRAGDPHGGFERAVRVVPRSRIKAPVRKPSANELGNAPLGVTGAWKRKIEATAEIFRNHFSLACSPQSGMGIVYVKHRTNRMRINFSPRLSNNKGWTGRLFFVGRRKGEDIPEWDFPVRVVEPLRKADMAPFLIQGAAAASQSLNTVGVNHAEGYLTEYKLAKAVVRGGAVKEALETAATAGAASLPQPKRKEKRKAALVESQAGGRTSEEEVSNELRARKKKKATKSMPRVVGSAAEVEEEEEDLEPLLARGPRLRTRTPEKRASVTPLVDRSEAVMKMSAELGLIMSAAVLGEESTQGPGDAEEGRATAFAASATEDGGEVRPATRQEAIGADRASASTSAVAMTSGSGQPKDLVIDVALIPSAAATAGDESSGDDYRPLTEVLRRRLPEVPSVAALEATLRRDLPAEKTPEITTEEYHPENQDDDVVSDVDLEALVDGISTSLGVLKALAARSRRQKYLYEAQSAFCKDLTVRHKAREADLEEEVKNLKSALQASELNVAVARAEKDALAKVVSDARVRAVTDYKTGSDYKEELEQYGARCYRVGLNAGREFGERLSWVERAREAFEAAVRECRRRTNDARLDDVRFAQFQSGRMPSSDE